MINIEEIKRQAIQEGLKKKLSQILNDIRERAEGGWSDNFKFFENNMGSICQLVSDGRAVKAELDKTYES